MRKYKISLWSQLKKHLSCQVIILFWVLKIKDKHWLKFLLEIQSLQGKNSACVNCFGVGNSSSFAVVNSFCRLAGCQVDTNAFFVREAGFSSSLIFILSKQLWKFFKSIMWIEFLIKVMLSLFSVWNFSWNITMTNWQLNLQRVLDVVY